jgi:DNA-binding response OmpR family regulator
LKFSSPSEIDPLNWWVRVCTRERPLGRCRTISREQTRSEPPDRFVRIRCLENRMAHYLLLCEDNRDLRRMLALEISDATSDHWKVLPAENATSARTVLGDRAIDAALIDLHLAQEDGLEIASEIRAASPDLPIMIMSGASRQVQEDVEQLGYLFVSKPFAIREIVDRLLSGNRQNRGRSSGPQHLSLLIVDDNRDFLSFMRRLFEAQPTWTCYTAETAEEAETIIRTRKPDAAMIDCMLEGGGKGGLELALALRAEAPHAIVVMMSGEREGNADAAQAHGFQFLQKPFLVSDVTKHILPTIIEKTKVQSTIELFYSYSHRDEKLRKGLEKHLALLSRQGAIETWYDRKIEAGRDFEKTIDVYVERADIILLLISSDFLASEFCYGREMERALERHREGKARVVPVILRPVDWLEAPFRGLLALPTDGRPVTKWPDRDEAFLDIAKGIRRIATELLRERARRS